MIARLPQDVFDVLLFGKVLRPSFFDTQISDEEGEFTKLFTG